MDRVFLTTTQQQHVNATRAAATRAAATRAAATHRTALSMCAAVFSISLLSGCVSSEFVRYPQWMASYPQAENQAWQRQMPFADSDIGPSTDSMPRDYDRPRSEARRAAEQKMLQGVPVGPESIAPGIPQGGLRRSRAVY